MLAKKAPGKGGRTLDEIDENQLHVAEIIQHGDKLILPEGMTAAQARSLLEQHEKHMEATVNLVQDIDVFPWDGANALAEVLKQLYGWAPASATPGFFRDNPPARTTIKVGPYEEKEVPWGRFKLPNVDGHLDTDISQKNGRFIFRVVAEVRQKDSGSVKRLFEEVKRYCAQNSIYRGKALKIRFLDDDGDALSMPEPEFMDVMRIDETMLTYPDHISAAIETNLFTPIERVQDCLANGLPVKRGVLLGGPFGTGKTLAATVAAKKAVMNGITYLYVPRADELKHAIEFAKQYQSPACVIFCEDIDRVMDGERDVEMDDILNIIDGIDTKSANIITVLTTNELERINPAMLRPGRLDAVIKVLPPDAAAAERLLRKYGGDTIDATTDLTEAGKSLEGVIPAVIAEVVKRAKLSQLRLQPPGEPIAKLSAEALAEAARTMRDQRDLLEQAMRPKVVENRLEDAFSTLVREVVSQEVNNGATAANEMLRGLAQRLGTKLSRG